MNDLKHIANNKSKTFGRIARFVAAAALMAALVGWNLSLLPAAIDHELGVHKPAPGHHYHPGTHYMTFTGSDD